MARLVFVTGKRISEDVVVKDGMVVGRHKDCRLTIGDEKASRKHARIVKEGGRYFIVDLKSSNGTFLNEMRVKKSALNYGDRIRIGRTVLVFAGEPEDELVGGTLGGFQVMKRLRLGETGVYYLGRQVALDREVTLYVLDQQLGRDTAAVRAFAEQTKRASTLRHPNILQVFDVQSADGRTFCVMEHFGGEPYPDFAGKNEPSMHDRLVVARGCARALAHAHAHDVVHGAVSPANVLVDDSLQVKVTGFALLAQRISLFSRPVLSLAYMSPEEAMGKSLKPASDVYSLGAWLYELASGRPMFSEKTAAAMVKAHCERTPEALSGVPATLMHLVGQMTDKRADARPTAATVEKALVEIVKNMGGARRPAAARARVPRRRPVRAPRPHIDRVIGVDRLPLYAWLVLWLLAPAIAFVVAYFVARIVLG